MQSKLILNIFSHIPIIYYHVINLKKVESIQLNYYYYFIFHIVISIFYHTYRYYLKTYSNRSHIYIHFILEGLDHISQFHYILNISWILLARQYNLNILVMILVLSANLWQYGWIFMTYHQEIILLQKEKNIQNISDNNIVKKYKFNRILLLPIYIFIKLTIRFKQGSAEDNKSSLLLIVTIIILFIDFRLNLDLKYIILHTFGYLFVYIDFVENCKKYDLV